MAFNFNWSPLTADADFYTRAQDMLTAALNKSPKPPIIVDDIIVNELNLGSVPPELEILEIGDLAEDRFRGIFKMCYSGDAFLTLKTRVQANPLNTYLFSKPSFASPQPLAASSGLTIPLQITLSHIKLSAFIILVFSRQKGLTLVFRNDPLESLTVSSTFDSIPFVREYLQKEIEGQLRVLMMDELPAIIHRLSLRLWCPDSGASSVENEENDKKTAVETGLIVDPFASPPQDAVDAHGNVLDADEISSLSLEGGSETHSLFSQKNLLRLATLSNSQRTLSLFTPSIRDAVFRAWAGPTERGDSTGISSTTSCLSRTQSYLGNSTTTYTFSDNGSEASQISSRPSLTSLPSMIGLSLGSGRYAKSHGRKKKNRVVNLRRAKSTDDSPNESGQRTAYTGSSCASTSDSLELPSSINEGSEADPSTPPRSPQKFRSRARQDSIDLGETATPKPQRTRVSLEAIEAATVTHAVPMALRLPESVSTEPLSPHLKRPVYSRTPAQTFPLESEKSSKSNVVANALHTSQFPDSDVSLQACDMSGRGIIEQAWMIKLANEMTFHAQHNPVKQSTGFWENRTVREEMPPPAYIQ